ncbi:UNVERIFIED_CONTAM: hypothetical protein Sindi_0516800 [Sesamum indicum]
MDLGSDEGTSRPRRRGQKRDKPQHRRMWTTLEEECLVAGLRNLLVTGWKCENGFRNGYLSQLEAYIARSFPNADIKADPHITSKLHVWKSSTRRYQRCSRVQVWVGMNNGIWSRWKTTTLGTITSR